jgi:hypothetical protein
MKKNHTAQNKTVAIARFSQSVGCCRQAQVVFFSIHCVIGGVKTRRKERHTPRMKKTNAQ